MDVNREIRFLIPPFFFLSSLFLGRYLQCPTQALDSLKQIAGLNLIGALAAATVLTLSLGYLIGALSITIMRILSHFAGCIVKALSPRNWSFYAQSRNYEAIFNDKTFLNAWRKLGRYGRPSPSQTFYASTTFIHSKTPEQVHSWLLRRWNTFNLSAHICVSVLLAHFCGYLLSVRQDYRWWIATGTLLLLFGTNSIVAYIQTAHMISFQSKLLSSRRPLR